MHEAGLPKGSLWLKKVLITRPASQSEKTSHAVKIRGGVPVLLPMIRIELLALPSETLENLKPLSQFQWIVFSSANGVSGFYQNLREQWLAIPEHQRPFLAAVGEATAHQMQACQLPVDFQPAKATGHELGRTLPLESQKPVLFPCGDQAREALPGNIRQRGIAVYQVVVYQNSPVKYTQPEFSAALNDPLDAILFTSPSTVNAFFEQCREHQCRPRHSTVIACIGATTGRQVKQWSYIPHLIPDVPRLDQLLDALGERLSTLHS